MGDAYFELGELTSKIGDKLAAALAAHRKGLAVRRELASEPVVDVEASVDVARSLFAAGYLLEETGNPVESLARFEEVRILLESLPDSAPGAGGRLRLARFGLPANGGRTGKRGEDGRGDDGLPAVRGGARLRGRRQSRRHRIPKPPGGLP